MRIDRTLQLDVLRTLRESYPNSPARTDLPGLGSAEFNANLWYLHEHGLIDGVTSGTVADRVLMNPTITARGLDFLEGDGGVSAILQTVTVRIDPDDLRALIAARIESSDLPTEEKDCLAHAIRSLPAQALRDLTTRLVNEAVGRWPDALQLFQTYAVP